MNGLEEQAVHAKARDLYWKPLRAQLTQVQPRVSCAWFVGVLGPLFRSAGHKVRNQHGLKASAGQRRDDVEIWNYLRDQAGSRSLVFDLIITSRMSVLAQVATCNKMAT
jgi:hypothetical protein